MWDHLCYLGDLEYEIPAESTNTEVTPVVDLYGMNEWSETSLETLPATVDMNIEFNLDRLEKSKDEKVDKSENIEDGEEKNQESQEKLTTDSRDNLDQDLNNAEQKEDTKEEK